MADLRLDYIYNTFGKEFCDSKKFNEKNKEISDEIYSAYLRSKRHE